MKILLPFFIAVQFLTRLPVPALGVQKQNVMGRSLLYYPLVGLLVGATLAALNAVLADAPTLLRAVLLLTAWIMLTGALHLDGLADSADAWIGGIGNRKRTLAIMKDPYCGPAAVVTLIVALLLKTATLQAIEPTDWLLLAIIPMLARTSTLLLFLTTPYVRPGGLGTALAIHLPRTAAIVVVVVAASIALLLGTRGAWLLLAMLLTFALLRAMMKSRIDGTTGDTAGATIEITEIAMLVALTYISRQF